MGISKIYYWNSHIPNIKIFENLVYSIPHISVNICVTFTKFWKSLILKAVCRWPKIYKIGNTSPSPIYLYIIQGFLNIRLIIYIFFTLANLWGILMKPREHRFIFIQVYTCSMTTWQKVNTILAFKYLIYIYWSIK